MHRLIMPMYLLFFFSGGQEGSFTKIGSSLLIMAIGGGAILPLIYGWITDPFSPHLAYWMMIPCYGVILFYAVRGHRLVSK